MESNIVSLMKYLLILNDPPYGTERSYNGLRLAMSLVKDTQNPEVRIFLLADAVTCAVQGQKTPEGYYNLERMLRALITKKVLIKCCGTCLDARGFDESILIKGVQRGSMTDLALWTAESERVITF
ncbi:MAG: DsrE family protein [Candidatus Thorarchaeota archaeon]|nr:DsrE family protein [Candidatus Thorarchaeota archaeon]